MPPIYCKWLLCFKLTGEFENGKKVHTEIILGMMENALGLYNLTDYWENSLKIGRCVGRVFTHLNESILIQLWK